MKLHELSPAPGSVKERKRKGRGIGTGNGKTAGKGHKGQKARSGGGVRPGFEGGQMPLQRRIPKRGFVNIFAKQYAVINIRDLDKLEDGAVITLESLLEAGVVRKPYDGLKVLAAGETKKKFTVKTTAISKAAKDKIEAAGGKVEVV